MWRYLIRRMVLFFATSLVMMAVLFIATSLFPVEKSYSLSGIEFPTPQQHEQLTQIYQLDNNLFSQFTAYLRERLSGNLGISSNSQQSVADELMSVLPASLELSLFAGA